ncbi:MAG: phosphotransferase [Ignavibacteriales bacterium]
MNFKKANFANDEILKVLEKYYLDFKNVEIKNLEGIANNNYRILSKDFDIVLKVYSHGQSDYEKIKKEIEAVSLFRKEGIKVPEYIYGLNGEILQEYEGFNIVAAKYIEGKVLSEIEFTNELMYEVGTIVASIEKNARNIDISNFKYISFKEEFEYVYNGIDKVIFNRGLNINIEELNQYLPQIYNIISKLDSFENKQFLHKDIWACNLIKTTDNMYLLDFNDWSIGHPVVELSNALLQFSMYKSGEFNVAFAKNIINGYKSIKNIEYTPIEIWEGMMFICYLYFAYNAIQADDIFYAEIYLKRVNTLLKDKLILQGML